MSTKSIFLSLSFVAMSAVSFAGNEVQPLDAPEAIVMIAEVDEACTLSASFSSGGSTVDVTVTAETCGGAAATLGAIARAIDEQ